MFPNKHIVPSRIFAGGKCDCGAIKDACQGDSGGPLFKKYKGKYYLLGIVSCGMKCGEENYPGIYTKVFYFNKWIKSN